MPRLIVVLCAAAIAAPAAAAPQPMSLEQIERKYPSMNYVHIAKCDYDNDGIFQQKEQICVQNMYRALRNNR